MAVRTLDRPVLVCDAAVVAGGHHTVVAHQPLVAPRQVLLGVAVEVAECRRQAVATVLPRHTAQRPQRILKALGQHHEALAAEHNMGMLKTRECQSKVIEPMRQRDADNRDAERACVGEVRKAKTTALVLLSEDNVPFWAGQRPPGPHAAFQRAPDAEANLGMAPPELFENRYSAQPWRRLQNRDDLAIRDIAKRIRPSSATRNLFPGRQPWIILNPVAGRRAEAGFGGRNGSVVGLSVTHVQPHLVVGDVEAGRRLFLSFMRRIRSLTRSLTTARRKTRRRGRTAVGRATPSLRQPSPGAFSS